MLTSFVSTPFHPPPTHPHPQSHTQVGVLSLENSTVSIINSSMTQNWGQMVGALWIDRGSVVDLKYTVR